MVCQGIAAHFLDVLSKNLVNRLLYVDFFPRSFTLQTPLAYGPRKQEMGGDAAPDAFIASRMVVGQQVSMKFLK